ncbi:MAG: tryptophan synthase subunit alpha [Chlamydiae bacterium]|nr:tryptophan synthase subunit alpha [Chlamydiota bacterium]MBI3277067.1 tryptophan synthase subunit alpha [Chlamydiota bacterium]
MKRIENKFFNLSKEGKKGLITYITAGDPGMRVTEDLVYAFDDLGVDGVELGIPFSDPLADGVVNQLAAQRSLKAGTTVHKVLDLVSRIRKKSEIPIVFFTYLNPILKYGLNGFARDASNAGVDGILVLDLPPEEASEYCQMMSNRAIDTVFLVAPTSSDERIKKISSFAKGFIYCVSRTGVTGMQSEISQEVPQLVGRIRKISSLPVAVGFGISGPEQVKALAQHADAVVVGSAIVKKIEENVSSPNLVKEVKKFVKTLVGAIHE